MYPLHFFNRGAASQYCGRLAHMFAFVKQRLCDGEEVMHVRLNMEKQRLCDGGGKMDCEVVFREGKNM